MKIENLKEAAKAGDDYERAVKALQWAQNAKYFDSACGPTRDATIRSSSGDALYVEMCGPSGQFAADIREALLRYRAAHVALAADRLKELGVEVPAPTAHSGSKRG